MTGAPRPSATSRTTERSTGPTAGGTAREGTSDRSVIKVLLVDDHQLVRRGIGELLNSEDDIEVVGEASNGDEAMRRLQEVSPDVVILDLRLGEGERSGVEVCREIRSARPEIACLMLTSASDADTVAAAALAGASAYLLKRIMGFELVDSIRLVAAGKSLLQRNVESRTVE